MLDARWMYSARRTRTLCLMAFCLTVFYDGAFVIAYLKSCLISMIDLTIKLLQNIIVLILTQTNLTKGVIDGKYSYCQNPTSGQRRNLYC